MIAKAPQPSIAPPTLYLPAGPAAAAAWGARGLATMAWEGWVPLDTRGVIDAGLEDFLHKINPASWFTDGL
mgnify:CR=1 FL=1